VTEQRKESFGSKPWQAKISRRWFLAGSLAAAGAAGLAGVLPDSVLKAAAATPPSATFDLSQVKHLVFLMQENRSFDHYFGTFPGVRGFSDPRAARQGNGELVFRQPDPANPDGFLEPFHISTVTTGAAAIPDLSHAWSAQHFSWNNGLMNNWVNAHLAADGEANGQYTMGYYTQEDIPFHWALAETFTLLDNYHCSVMGPTDPNRLMWSNGGIDPQGLAGGPILTTGDKENLSFTSGAETLWNAGITFKNYTDDWDTRWVYFNQLRVPAGLPTALINSAVGAKGTLWGNGLPGGIGDPANPTLATNASLAFEEDCANGVLPDVSFIGTNESWWEHPSSIPAAGAQFLASKIGALAANEDLWNTTAFVLNYDENDGFFDHVAPPVPDPTEYPEEFVTMINAAGNTPGLGFPIGGGFRVPCFIISPWSVGGKIFSEVNDHTSCLRLIESVAAAGGLSGTGPVTFPNISRWRRATFGDLTGALGGQALQAPSNPQFNPALRAANVAAQTAASALPQPLIPQGNQVMPVQLTRW
jgi:phospholipase C